MVAVGSREYNVYTPKDFVLLMYILDMYLVYGAALI